jgi:hypothetical protein
MGNVSQLTHKRVYWDAQKDAFTDAESNRYLKPEYHNNYKLPNV